MSLKIIVLFLCSLYNIFNVESVEVKTTSGTVRGKTIHFHNKTVNQFLNIPYAEPPVGNLRFAKPITLRKPIDGIIDGTKTGHSCLQYGSKKTTSESEDCLVLNIWSESNQKTNESKPVMFWIHGGGFNGGSSFSSTFNGTALSTYDVVIVTINYRLGPFGFLYGDSESAPGNVGLFDQNMALKWVKQNIHSFGGNPNEITIFGESAGSWSVSAHILSPISRGLFKRAIIESGAIFDNKNTPTLSRTVALSHAKETAKHFNCSVDNQWLDCLRGIDSHLLNSYHNIRAYAIHQTEFLPLIAQNAFKTHNYSTEIDLMGGVMQNEGSLAHGSFPQSEHLKSAKELTELIGKTHFPEINSEKISEFYLNDTDTNSTETLRKAFYDFYGDIHIACPAYHFVKAFSEYTPKKNVHFYLWTYLSNEMRSRSGCTKQMGICHGSENGYVFGVPVLKNMTDKQFSEDVMKIWTNFAKNGQPLEGFPSSMNWPRFTQSDASNNITKVKEFNLSKPNHIIENLFEKTCDGFWKSYYI